MKILALGDVVGRNAVAHLEKNLWNVRNSLGADVVVVNGENASDIYGIDESDAKIILASGADVITLAPEAKRGQMRDISAPVPASAVVYGRLPLMLMLRCAISDGECQKKDRCALCTSGLTDRHGVHFPLYGMSDCTNVIYNSVPLYMADKKDSLSRTGAAVYHFIFTDETPEECDEIIKAYISGAAPRDGAAIRRMP